MNENKNTVSLDYKMEYELAMRKLREISEENEQYRKALLNLALSMK